MKETRFKDTEIGRIPEDWEATSIEKLCTLKARIGWQGLTTGEYLLQGDYILITGTDFKDGYIDWKNCWYVSKWRYDQDSNIQIKEGDVLISKDGTIGKVAFINSTPGPGTLNSGVFVVRPKQKDIVNQGYLSWIFKSIWFKSFIDQLTAGSTINHLYQKDFVNFKLVYPNDISEQTRIASALTSIDNLISSLDKLIEKKKAIKEGTMQQLLTGKKRLKGFNEPWYHYTLGDCTTIKARIGWQGLTASEYLDYGQYYLVTAIDINEGKISWDTCHYVSEERYLQDKNIQILPFDVLVSKDGTIGKVAFLDTLPGPGTLNSGVFVIRSKMKYLTQEYLAQVFLSKYFDNFIKEIVAGSTIVHLYQKDIVKFSFDAPSSIKEQQTIVSFISSINEEIASLESKRNKYIKTKQGMMQQLLTGRIRLA